MKVMSKDEFWSWAREYHWVCATSAAGDGWLKERWVTTFGLVTQVFYRDAQLDGENQPVITQITNVQTEGK